MCICLFMCFLFFVLHHLQSSLSIAAFNVLFRHHVSRITVFSSVSVEVVS